MDVKQLIPKHKHDDSVIGGLKALSFEELLPIIPQLLEWLQDMNWPISRPVLDILAPHADKLSDELLAILKTDDQEWKYWILGTLIKNLTDKRLIIEVERIAKFPTESEIASGVNLKAIYVLNGDYK